MEAGSFDIRSYLTKLYEEAETTQKNQEGLIIPDTNEKVYKWLQGEFNKGKTEVKVEMKSGGGKFNPGYEMQTNLKSVKEFKPGIYGNDQKTDTTGLKQTDFKTNASKQPDKDGAKQTISTDNTDKKQTKPKQSFGVKKIQINKTSSTDTNTK